MSEPIQRWRAVMLAIAAALALIVVAANLVHTGKVAWAGVVIAVIAVAVWRGARRSHA